MKAVKGLFPTKPDTGTQTKQPEINKINILAQIEKKHPSQQVTESAMISKHKHQTIKWAVRTIKYKYLCSLTGKPRFLNISYHKDLDLKQMIIFSCCAFLRLISPCPQ